jgi:hypothetical protein
MNDQPLDIERLIQELRNLRLRIEQIEHVLSAQDTANHHTEEHLDNYERDNEVNGIAVGDTVRVKNKVKKPATWIGNVPWSASKERIATVTRVTPRQIHFVTGNGTNTWRAPNNLEKLH